MDYSAIESKRQAASDRFDALRVEGEKKRQEIDEIEDELKKLQGEYRALTELLDEAATKQTKATPVVEEATLIDVEPTLKEEDQRAKRTK